MGNSNWQTDEQERRRANDFENATAYGELERKTRGAGGTSGGIFEFLMGLAMAIGGGYLFLNQVTVTSNLWTLWGYKRFRADVAAVADWHRAAFFQWPLKGRLAAHFRWRGHHCYRHHCEPDGLLAIHQPLQHADHLHPARGRSRFDRALAQRTLKQWSVVSGQWSANRH